MHQKVDFLSKKLQNVSSGKMKGWMLMNGEWGCTTTNNYGNK